MACFGFGINDGGQRCDKVYDTYFDKFYHECSDLIKVRKFSEAEEHLFRYLETSDGKMDKAFCLLAVRIFGRLENCGECYRSTNVKLSDESFGNALIYLDHLVWHCDDENSSEEFLDMMCCFFEPRIIEMQLRPRQERKLFKVHLLIVKYEIILQAYDVTNSASSMLSLAQTLFSNGDYEYLLNVIPVALDLLACSNGAKEAYGFYVPHKLRTLLADTFLRSEMSLQRESLTVNNHDK